MGTPLSGVLQPYYANHSPKLSAAVGGFLSAHSVSNISIALASIQRRTMLCQARVSFVAQYKMIWIPQRSLAYALNRVDCEEAHMIFTCSFIYSCYTT